MEAWDVAGRQAREIGSFGADDQVGGLTCEKRVAGINRFMTTLQALGLVDVQVF